MKEQKGSRANEATDTHASTSTGSYGVLHGGGDDDVNYL